MIKLLLIISILSSFFVSSVFPRLDVSHLTEEEHSKLLDQIVAVDFEKLTPTQKLEMQIKMKKMKGLITKNCPYFHWQANVTGYLVDVYNCRENFVGTGDWDDLTAEEYPTLVCDSDNWKEYVDCILPITQTFISSLFQCFLGEEWIRPPVSGGLVDNIQYTFQLFPKLLDSFWKMMCANRRFMMNSFELRKDSIAFQRIIQTRLAAGDKKAQLRLGFCMIRSREDKSPSDGTTQSLCSFVTTVDVQAAYKCILEEFKNDPEAAGLLKKLYPTFKFLLDKNEGGPTKAALYSLLWKEFCTEQGQLSHLFKEKPNPTEEKLKAALEEIASLKAQLQLNMIRLDTALQQVTNMENEIKTLKEELSKFNALKDEL